MKVNLHWIAELSNFAAEKDEKFTRAKLKVFYKGETADHRLFSNEFSDKLRKTLPYTPVVGYYDAKKDDFVAHSTQQQIYGIVDPNSTFEYVKDDDGKDWLTCGVVLYTERPDDVGKIAKKIVGHKQSLEMDPKTVKYVINYDERKQFKNIEFTDGEFIGVSVVGEDQTPAFAGSEFFTADDEFVKKMTILKNYCQNKENANTKMHTLEEFLKLSYGAISEKVNCAVNQAYSTEDTWIYMIDVFDDCAIFNFTNVKDGKRKLMKIGYSVAEDGTVFLGKINEVCVKYEDVEEKSENNGEQGTDKMTNAAGKTPVESTTPQVPTAPMPSTTATTAPATEALKTPETDNTIVKTETVPTAPTTATTAASATSAPAENKTVLNVNKTDNKEGLANGKTTPDTTSTTTLTTQSPDSSSTASATSKEPESKTDESDKKARLELLTSYKDYLSDEQYTTYLEELDTKWLNKDALEIALLKDFKSNSVAKTSMSYRPFYVSSGHSNNDTNDNSDLAKYIRKNLTR